MHARCISVRSHGGIIETKIVWKIREFPYASREKVLQSEPFLIGDFTWFLVLFPNGDISDARGWCSVFLHVEPDDLPRGKAVTTECAAAFRILRTDLCLLLALASQ